MNVLFFNRKNQLIALACCCFLFVFIIKPWQLYFLNDDFIHIPDHQVFLSAGFMRPVANFFLLLDKWLYGKNASGFFVTSLILHFSCVFSVYFLTKIATTHFFSEKENDKLLLPFITAFLFLWYPYHAEPIMWVIGRGAIIAAIFTFLSLIFYIKATNVGIYILLSWLCYVIALFTYESMWNVLLLFAFISWFNFKKKQSSAAKELAFLGIMFITFSLYILLRKNLLGTVAGDGYKDINNNISNIAFLLANFFKLIGRNFIIPSPNTLLVVGQFALSLVFYGYLLVKVFKKNAYTGWFLLALCAAVASGVITATPLGIDTHYNESERYIYYSSFYYCLFISFIIVFFLSQKKQLYTTGILAFIFACLLAGLQKNYCKASAITRSTKEMFEKYTNYKRAILVDIPEKYKGTMTMRLDPKPLQNWMVPQAKYDTILVPTQITNLPIQLPYKTGEKTWEEMAEKKNWNKRMLQIPDSLNNMNALATEDVVFWYCPDGVYKINIPLTLFQKKE